MEGFINKVAESGIITVDLAPYLPDEKNIGIFDLKPFLYKEMILREKDYRTALQTLDWSQYNGKHVAIFCSTDAIIPVWAFMLAAAYLHPIALSVYTGTKDEIIKHLIYQNINQIHLKN